MAEQTVRADRSRLKQLLENIFRNAVEHGGANVSVTIGDLESKNGFYVEDDGAGFAEGDHAQLFDPGFSTDQWTGLGLNIVEQIANAHGWDVSVSESRAGGTRFEFTGIESTAEATESPKSSNGEPDTPAEGSDD